MSDNKNREDHPLVRENANLSTRLTLAQAFVGMWQKAYDALLSYGINFRTLGAYKDTAGLDAALEAKDMNEAQGKVMSYIGGVENDIAAAIRRKQFRKV